MNFGNQTIGVFLFLVYSIWLPPSVVAQANTLVKGTITNNNARISTIDLMVNTRFLNGNIDTYQSNILDDGTFAFAVEITEPQLVQLVYARNSALLYLEPNDTLDIAFDANTFRFSFVFSGRAGANNQYLNEYFKKYPRELDPFKYLQYRSGSYWYKIDPDKDRLMRSSTYTQFTQQVQREREEGLTNLAFFHQNNPNQLTQQFRAFLEAEIYYDWAYHMMLFGEVYKGMHGLDEGFFSFLEQVPLQHEQIGSHWYQLFLMAYMNRQYMRQSEKADNPYTGQYQLAQRILSEKPLAYVQSEVVNIGFAKKYIDGILPAYNDFIQKNTYRAFDEKVVYAYQKAMKTAAGTPAPDFTLQLPGGTDTRLSELKGKVVFLNFWATWCRPCIKKMKDLQQIQESSDENIVFVHISFDKDADTWEKHIRRYSGIHLQAPAGIHSEIAQKYDVRALPQYFMIDKQGNFAEKPPVFSVDDLSASLRLLNR